MKTAAYSLLLLTLLLGLACLSLNGLHSGLLASVCHLGEVLALVAGIVALCGLLRFQSLKVTTITSVQINGAREGQEEKTPLNRC